MGNAATADRDAQGTVASMFAAVRAAYRTDVPHGGDWTELVDAALALLADTTRRNTDVLRRHTGIGPADPCDTQRVVVCAGTDGRHSDVWSP
jgi:hypothetical protein